MFKPTLRSIYVGRRCVGFMLDRGKVGVEAFDTNENSLGVFPDKKSAADAICGSAP
jgi:hypothetical protein